MKDWISGIGELDWIGGGDTIISCRYPLTGDVSVIPGAIPMRVTGNIRQTASYTTQATGTEYNAYALPSGYATFSITTGLRQWGWTGISVPLVGTANSLAYLTLLATDTAGATRMLVSLSSIYTGGSLKCRMIVTDSASVKTTVDTATTPSAVWIVQDCGAATARLFADYGAGPVEIALTGDSMTAGATALSCYVQQLDAMPAEYEGQTMGATLVTVAGSMPAVAYDAVDPCGNSVTAWTPAVLFNGGVTGAWYDPSDFSTMFQDAAGTTPVTAVGQSVGLRLDKSRGLALGVDRVTNGTFATDTDWTKGTGWSIGSGVATKTAGSAAALTQTLATTAGRWYKVTATITRSAGTLTVSLGTSGTAAAFTASYSGVFYILAGSSTQTLSFSGDASFAGTVDSVVVQSIAGNHAYQSSLSSRPVLELVSGCYGIKYDGSNDGYVTPSINFTGTDKMTVFAGVHKLSDAALGVVVELSAVATSNNGTFILTAPVSAAANFGFFSRGTSSASAGSPASYPAPMSAVLTGVGDISGDISRLRCNGANISSSTMRTLALPFKEREVSATETNMGMAAGS